MTCSSLKTRMYILSRRLRPGYYYLGLTHGIDTTKIKGKGLL